MKVRNVPIVFRKELLDITRDRRTLTFMILLPILIYPLLMFVIGRVTLEGMGKLRARASRIAVLGGENAPPELLYLLAHMDALTRTPPPLFLAELRRRFGRVHPFVAGVLQPTPAEREKAAELLRNAKRAQKLLGEVGKVGLLEVVPFRPPGEALAAALRRRDRFLTPRLFRADGGPFAAAAAELRAAALRAIEDGDLDALVIFPTGFRAALDRGAGAEVTVILNEATDRCKVALAKLRALFRRGGRGVTLARLKARGLGPGVLRPVRVATVNVGKKENLLARLLPYLIVLMCFAGSVYPAIDLGAGEKERGTLETLLVCPASRTELVAGKFLVVMLTAMVAAFLNVLSLSLSLHLGLLRGVPGLGMRFDAQAALLTALLMLPTAALFAGLLLSISIFARSFKEAQSYIVPLNMAVIIPALFSFLPGVELGPGLAFVPILNVALALKEAWTARIQVGLTALIFLASVLYAAAAILFCAAWFRRESVLFRS